jgi:hypothetical protein
MGNSPTQLAPDWWESRVFKRFAWLEAGSVKVGLSRPAHQRIAGVEFEAE